jgi:hypothetical protein
MVGLRTPKARCSADREDAPSVIVAFSCSFFLTAQTWDSPCDRSRRGGGTIKKLFHYAPHKLWSFV